jgi:hypothetical protein
MIDKGTFRQVSGYGQSESLLVLVRIDDDGNKRSVAKLEYVSPFLQVMMDATSRFGITSSKNPPKAELEAYFKRQKLPDGTPISPSQAKAMATFVRPPEAMKSGQKKRRRTL